MVAAGTPLPNVSFTRGDGSVVKLGDLVGAKTLVLYFYPKDDSPGCTTEACSFRDSYEAFLQAGAEVVGVSADDAGSHEAFKARHRLPFPLLSDPGGVAAKALGVKKTFGLIAGRVTFVIDRAGVVQHRFDSQLRVNKHVDEALELVKHLEQKTAASRADGPLPV